MKGCPPKAVQIAGSILCSIAVAIALSGCERKPTTSVQAAHTPSVTGTPRNTAAPRIVAFSPAVGIILSDLGYDATIVGRHGFDSFLPQSLAVCGDQSGPDYERLLEVAPTLIITQWGTRDLPTRLRSLAREQGWALHDERLLSLDDIRAAVVRIDRLARGLPLDADPADADFGRPATPEQVADMSEAGRAMWERMNIAWPMPRRTGTGSSPRVLLLASLAPPAAFGPGSCHHQVLVSVAGHDAPALQRGDAYVVLDQEDIMSLAADIYIIIDSGAAAAQPGLISAKMARVVVPSPDMIPPGPGFAGLHPKNTRLITDPQSQIPSTSMVRFAEDLVECLAQIRAGGGTEK